MANVFKNAKLALTDSDTLVYTCPAVTTAIVLMIQIANIDGTNAVDVDCSWTDDSDSDTETFLAKTVTLPADASLGVLSGKMVLEAGDTIKGMASADGDAELTLSVLEIS